MSTSVVCCGLVHMFWLHVLNVFGTVRPSGSKRGNNGKIKWSLANLGRRRFYFGILTKSILGGRGL
jgi:dUTPase